MRDSDFERLFAEHAESLFAFLAYRTGDRSEAEDLVSETFTRALRGHRRFDRRRGSETTWLYAIARNLAHDRARRADAERRALVRTGPPAESDFGSSLELIAERIELSEALARLNPVEREVLSLRFGADLTVPEIAAVVDQPLTTVEGRVYRGLRKLRTALGER